MKYFKENLKDKKALSAAHILLGVASAFLSSWTVWYFREILDSLGNKTLSAVSIFIYGAGIIVLCIVNYAGNYPEGVLSHGIFLGFKLMALRKMSTVDYLSYQSLGTGSLIQRIENGATAGKGMLYDFWFCIFRELLPSVVFSLIFIAEIDASIMACIGVGYIFVFIITNILLKYLYRIKEKILNNEELFNKYLIRGFTELTVFRVNRRFPSEIREAESASREIVSSKTKMLLIHESFFTIFALLVCLIKIIILYIGWKHAALSAGSIVALIMLTDNAYNPIAIFNVLFVQYKLNKSAFARLEAFLDMPDDERLVSGGDAVLNDMSVIFEKVKFEYDEKPALNDLCIKIPSGSAVAFVGESGSGKSTAVKLIAGLLRPAKGKVAVGGLNVAKVNLNSYYSLLSYTPQDSPVFNGTLRENVAFDKPISDESIMEVLKLVCLDEFCSSLKSGLDTVIGERGVMLSGGERQRLAIGRLYFSDAGVIILDEATSALDNITEEQVMNSLFEHMRGRTIITVAHRLTTVKSSDIIFAFQEGKIIEQGNFDALMSQQGYFYELWNAAKV